jgi:hypothetical protein
LMVFDLVLCTEDRAEAGMLDSRGVLRQRLTNSSPGWRHMMT